MVEVMERIMQRLAGLIELGQAIRAAV